MHIGISAEKASGYTPGFLVAWFVAKRMDPQKTGVDDFDCMHHSRNRVDETVKTVMLTSYQLSIPKSGTV